MKSSTEAVFYYAHVLRKPWVAPGLIKPPKSHPLPDIVAVAEVLRISAATHVLSYQMFFFTLYNSIQEPFGGRSLE
jgi:integrase/recombinase XerD